MSINRSTVAISASAAHQNAHERTKTLDSALKYIMYSHKHAHNVHCLQLHTLTGARTYAHAHTRTQSNSRSSF